MLGAALAAALTLGPQGAAAADPSPSPPPSPSQVPSPTSRPVRPDIRPHPDRTLALPTKEYLLGYSNGRAEGDSEGQWDGPNCIKRQYVFKSLGNYSPDSDYARGHRAGWRRGYEEGFAKTFIRGNCPH